MKVKGYYTVDQAAPLLVNGMSGKMGITPQALHDLIRRGKVRTERLGARHLVPNSEIERRNSEVREVRAAWFNHKEGKI
jgi:hypothetical protein